MTAGCGAGAVVGVAAGLGETDATGRDDVVAWTAPQAVKATARAGTISRIPDTRIGARGFYEARFHESIRHVLMFPAGRSGDAEKIRGQISLLAA